MEGATPAFPTSFPPIPMNRAARRAHLEAEIDQWRHLVWYVVNRIRLRLPVSVSEDELFSAGMFGLMKACRSYDPERGAEFKTYAYHRIRGAIGDELRRLDYLPRSLRDRAKAEGRDAPSILAIPTDEDGNESLAAPTAASEVETQDLVVVIVKEIEALPEKMRLVMELYYRQNLNMKEIGEQMHLTESRVSQIHSNARTRLRKAMERK